VKKIEHHIDWSILNVFLIYFYHTKKYLYSTYNKLNGWIYCFIFLLTNVYNLLFNIYINIYFIFKLKFEWILFLNLLYHACNPWTLWKFIKVFFFSLNFFDLNLVNNFIPRVQFMFHPFSCECRRLCIELASFTMCLWSCEHY
jgi:hypothetical protein